MSDKTALGDRMKAYEAVTRAVLPRRTYTIIRLDIRAGHTLLRDAEKPYDYAFMSQMDATAQQVCQEVSGARFAFTQSDEISILLTDFEGENSQPWFGGVVQKMVSISAAKASVAFSTMGSGRTALFDSRVFTVPDRAAVAEYFIWRQRDCVKNSIAMAAQAWFSPKELHGVNTNQMQEMLWAKCGINWNNYDDGAKRGRVVVKASGDREVSYVDRRSGETVNTTAFRSWWEIQPAPHFAFQSSPLLDMIPDYPASRFAEQVRV